MCPHSTVMNERYGVSLNAPICSLFREHVSCRTTTGSSWKDFLPLSFFLSIFSVLASGRKKRDLLFYLFYFFTLIHSFSLFISLPQFYMIYYTFMTWTTYWMSEWMRYQTYDGYHGMQKQSISHTFSYT